jgi:hypothetical protein
VSRISPVLAPLPLSAGKHFGSSSKSCSSHSNRSRSTRPRVPRIHKPPASSGTNRNSCATCERDAKGSIKRDQQARYEFKRSNPCPSTGRTRGACPGYDIDHHIPLAKGGPDDPANMQWLSKDQHKQKTKRNLQ